MAEHSATVFEGSESGRMSVWTDAIMAQVVTDGQPPMMRLTVLVRRAMAMPPAVIAKPPCWMAQKKS